MIETGKLIDINKEKPLKMVLRFISHDAIGYTIGVIHGLGVLSHFAESILLINVLVFS